MEWRLEKIGAPPPEAVGDGTAFVLGPETFAVLRSQFDKRGELQARFLTGWHQGEKADLASGAAKDGWPKAVSGSHAPLVLRVRTSDNGIYQGARLLVGRNRLYIDEEETDLRRSYLHRGTGKVHAWDASGLHAIAGPGDVVQMGGTTLTLQDAELAGVTRSGAAVIFFAANKPSRTYGVAVHDEHGLTAILAENYPVPGFPSATLDTCPSSPSPTDDGGFVGAARVVVNGRKIKGIFYFSLRESRPLLDYAAPFSSSEAESSRTTKEALLDLEGISFVEARDARTLVVIRRQAPWLCRDGTCIRIAIDAGRFSDLQQSVEDVVFLGADSSACTLTVRSYDTAGGRTTAERWDVYLFDGKKATRLSRDDEYHTTVAVAPSGGPYSGVLLNATRLLTQSSGYVTGLPAMFEAGSGGFVDANAVERGLQPVPIFRTSGGSSVRLTQVESWISPYEAIIRQGGALFRMRRTAKESVPN